MADGRDDLAAGAQALEEAIERLAEVRAARVVASPAGRILEIHLVSDGSKHPKQLTRDVETIAATQGLDIDRRTISIAQMPGVTNRTAQPPSPGIVLTTLAVSLEAGQTTCRVRVSHNDEESIGEATAPTIASGRARLVARAVMDALSHLSGHHATADCDTATIVDAGDHRVALAVLVVMSGDGAPEVLAGAHPVHGDADDAIARAVLNAYNRRRGV